jgi:RNA polymerase sigma-70 factor (ECF subfamily)
MTARQGGSPEARAALERLCQAYWYPLYAYVRRLGYSASDAEDLTQAYFLQLLEKNYLGAVDRRKGKFRSFLLAALNHFLANERDWHNAAKRGGGRTLVSLDDDESREERYRNEPASDLTPEKVFEARWAATVIEQARTRLREQYAAEGKAPLYDRLADYLSEQPDAGAYDTAAAELGMKPGAVAVAVHRLRQRYGEHIRSEIARTVARPEEIEDEWRHLREVLGGGLAGAAGEPM